MSELIISNDVKEIVNSMLGKYYALPQDLINILNRTNELCIKAGGKLRSRQEIAGIIAMYEFVDDEFFDFARELE